MACNSFLGQLEVDSRRPACSLKTGVITKSVEGFSTNQRRAAVLRPEAGNGFVAAEDDLGTPGQLAGQGLAEAIGRIVERILPEGMPIRAA